jgi:hypothetical protein
MSLPPWKPPWSVVAYVLFNQQIGNRQSSQVWFAATRPRCATLLFANR